MDEIRRVLLRTAEGERVVVDPLEVFLLEAEGDETRVRQASRREVVDLRELGGGVAAVFEPYGFVRVHREFVVNPRRVLLIRPRGSGRDWELKLEPPVNRVVPIARDRLAAVWALFGE